jgi:hypothetical protein
MSRQRMDADTAETMARVVQLLRRAAELVWAAVDVDGARSPRQGLGLASTWLRTRRGTCFRTRFRSTGRCRSGMNRVVSYGLLSSCCGAVTLSSAGAVTAAASVGDVRTVAIPASRWHAPVLAGFRLARAVGAGRASQEADSCGIQPVPASGTRRISFRAEWRRSIWTWTHVSDWGVRSNP